MGTAFAQVPQGQTSKMGSPDKEAISKACSDQANAKGLHGKARKKFRSECKRASGKAM
ncbi:MAG TPA: PsiF family protein [Xanthobacteraceae bacterium]|jgi:psiF repeat-containing protein|nr:PsiF family protein [Xanthobacteraceae bacterium]